MMGRESQGRRAGITLFATLALVGCGALDEFDHVMADEATIPGTLSQPGPFTLDYTGGFDDVDLSKEKSFANAGVTPGDVDAISIKSARLEGTKSIDRLDVLLNSVAIWVEAEGQPRQTIATVTSFPPMTTAIDMTVDSTVELKPYAVAPAMKVGADIDIKQQPALETTLRTTITLHIDINLLGS